MSCLWPSIDHPNMPRIRPRGSVEEVHYSQAQAPPYNQKPLDHLNKRMEGPLDHLEKEKRSLELSSEASEKVEKAVVAVTQVRDIDSEAQYLKDTIAELLAYDEEESRLHVEMVLEEFLNHASKKRCLKVLELAADWGYGLNEFGEFNFSIFFKERCYHERFCPERQGTFVHGGLAFQCSLPQSDQEIPELLSGPNFDSFGVHLDNTELLKIANVVSTEKSASSAGLSGFSQQHKGFPQQWVSQTDLIVMFQGGCWCGDHYTNEKPTQSSGGINAENQDEFMTGVEKFLTPGGVAVFEYNRLPTMNDMFSSMMEEQLQDQMERKAVELGLQYWKKRYSIELPRVFSWDRPVRRLCNLDVLYKPDTSRRSM